MMEKCLAAAPRDCAQGGGNGNRGTNEPTIVSFAFPNFFLANSPSFFLHGKFREAGA